MSDRPPAPTISDAQIAALADVARDEHALGHLGAAQITIPRAKLRDSLVNAGCVTRTDTGDPDTDGGRYRLHLTTHGRDQLARAAANRLIPGAESIPPASEWGPSGWCTRGTHDRCAHRPGGPHHGGVHDPVFGTWRCPCDCHDQPNDLLELLAARATA